MKVCKCGSMAINVDPEQKECDVCYWKNKFLKMEKAFFELIAEIMTTGEDK